MKIISGIKPTGRMHLGNFSTFKRFKDFQDEYTPYIFVADLHALTLPIDPEVVRKHTLDILAFYLASGLDVKKTVLFKQSDVLEVGMLNSILINYVYMGELSRMTQFKHKSANSNNESIGVGLFSYPVLMASDVFMYDCDLCPIGDDQVQHLELARDIANRLNNRYKEEILKCPKAMLSKSGTRIKSLSDPTKKMSKSDTDGDKGVLYLDDDIKVNRKKIMSAVTDMDANVYYDKENKPGISNLLDIYAMLSNKSIEEVIKQFEGMTRYGDFKKIIADKFEEVMLPFLDKYNKFRKDEKTLNKIFEENALKARKEASVVLERVLKKVGLK